MNSKYLELCRNQNILGTIDKYLKKIDCDESQIWNILIDCTLADYSTVISEEWEDWETLSYGKKDYRDLLFYDSDADDVYILRMYHIQHPILFKVEMDIFK